MYKRLRDLLGQIDNNRFLRLADGACIPRDPANTDWQQFLIDTENETINIADADPVPPPGLVELAQTALETINWQGWKDRIANGRTAVTAMDADTLGIPNAITRNRFVALFGGLLDAHEATGRMLHDILVALSRTDDNTPL